MKSHQPGKVLGGQWELEACIAAGGMGQIYRAKDLVQGRSVAVKVLDYVEEQSKGNSLERFFLEAQISRRLRHPNIVEIYDFGFDDELGFFMVMELLDGCDLSVFLEHHSEDISVEIVWDIFSPVCEAMSYAHNKDVIHRDLKPSNIFLLGGPEHITGVKILDFGIAKVTSGLASHTTQQGVILGTPRYLSPEQAQGHAVGHKADIYTLANILFEVLTRQPLFQSETAFTYLYKHVESIPSLLNEVCPERGYSTLLEQLLAGGLSKDPKHRPTSMKQFRNVLYKGLLGKPHPSEDPTDEIYIPPPRAFQKLQSSSTISNRTESSPFLLYTWDDDDDFSSTPSLPTPTPSSIRSPSSGPANTPILQQKILDPGSSSSLPGSSPRIRSARRLPSRSYGRHSRTKQDEKGQPRRRKGGWLVLFLFSVTLFSAGVYGWVHYRPKHPVSQKVVSWWNQSYQKAKQTIEHYRKPKVRKKRRRRRRSKRRSKDLR